MHTQTEKFGTFTRFYLFFKPETPRKELINYKIRISLSLYVKYFSYRQMYTQHLRVMRVRNGAPCLWEMCIVLSHLERKLRTVITKRPNITLYKSQFSFPSAITCHVTHRLTDIAQTVG